MSPRELRQLARLATSLADELESGATSPPQVARVESGDETCSIVAPTWCQSGGFVYFIRSFNAVKIGHAGDVQKRVHHVQCGNPNPVALVGFYWVADPKAEEAELHARFRDHLIRGEWFAWTDDIAAIVKRSATWARRAPDGRK